MIMLLFRLNKLFNVIIKLKKNSLNSNTLLNNYKFNEYI